MKKTIAIGVQDFESLRTEDAFYIDKTAFIREWWDNKDAVTLITRPRRFGKTLNLSMLNCFFSDKYAGRDDLFQGLNIWQEQRFQDLQGRFPVIFLTFAGIKGTTYKSMLIQIKKQIVSTFSLFPFLMLKNVLDPNEQKALSRISEEMSEEDAAYSLNLLSRLLEKRCERKVLIFLDEYDTPLQEAYIHGYWDEAVSFIRTLFNNTFKTNASLFRALLTGITRVSKESVFSDLNNLEVVTTTSEKYASCFGFTEAEVFQAMDVQGFDEGIKSEVKTWYDGFTFGTITDIYNPWSVTAFLDKGKLEPYWANTSGNALVSHLLRKGSNDLKLQFQTLLKGEPITVPLDEQVVFNQLDEDPATVWSLLLASGYLKVLTHQTAITETRGRKPAYTLMLTNLETHLMFENMVVGWFSKSGSFTKFAEVLLKGDLRGVNRYFNEVVLSSMSYFDTGNGPSYRMPENFYHGLVLGLLVDSAPDYVVRSNRESGYGRYDVVMEPKDPADPAVIMEFKVLDAEDGEKSLEDTAANALKQITEKKYETDLLLRGIPPEKIRKYGFAFQGKNCLVRMI